MNTGLILLVIVLFFVALALMRSLHISKKELLRFEGIVDLERYLAEVQQKVSDAEQVICTKEAEVIHLQTKIDAETQAAEEKARFALDKKLEKLREDIESLEKERELLATNVVALKEERAAVEDALELQTFGIYQTKFGLGTSEEYAQRLSEIREQQKILIKNEMAATCAQEWTVEGSRQKGIQMMKRQIKLMLRAFNGECDAAINKVKHNNAEQLATRMRKSFVAINKLGESNYIEITETYCQSKINELYLNHELKEKKQEEREELRRQKDEEKEEQKALKELQKAQAQADKEEQQCEKALVKARADLTAATDEQMAKMSELVLRLEAELKDTLERKAKAISRAQLTKSGHVYVISNIGSFGERVFKIGMTRRFEPLDRIKELGDSSVPFKFDLHAMIYSENAPELENQLHKHFHDRRVNKINLRREFFKVTLDEIRKAIAKYHGLVTFVIEPEAEEYRQTMVLDEVDLAS